MLRFVPALRALTAVTLLAAATPAPASGLSKALELAGANRPEIERAHRDAPAAQAASMEWLIAHMPEGDLRALDAKFLLAHVDGAYTAWKSAPWNALVDEATFRDAILPYASVSELRELWLPSLREKCLPMVRDAKSPAEAAVILNQRVFPEFKVAYSTKRKRADQAPSESMQSGLASCSGLSILLVDACRSVGVPARFVGVPMWTDGSGNHSWVEVWDGARWRYTGAAEPAGDRLDEGWFSGRASGQNRDKPEYAIYAVTWRDSGVDFPFMFDPTRPRARAVDVTDRYAGKAPAVPEGSRILRVCVRDPQTLQRVSRAIEVRDGLDKPIAHGTTKDERFDLNDHLELVMPAGAWNTFIVDGTRAQEVAFVSKGGEVTLAIITLPATHGATAPGAVSGRSGEDDLWIESALMPAEILAPNWDDKRPSEASNAAVRELQKFLKDGKVAEVSKRDFAGIELTKADAERAANALRKALEAEIRADAKAEFDSKVLEADGVSMPFWYAVYGEKPARKSAGRALYISMHGGGGAPKQVNDQQWDNQKKLYKPEEGVYVAPRAPTDTWNLWHQGHIDALFRELIADMIVLEDVDPNRVYLMGYSAGGDGVFQLAPRMADSFAAASMMAGHPNETRPDGLRNLPFAIFMGGKDAAFNRNEIARQWKTMLDGLSEKDPGGYPHEVTIHEENGHWMDRKDAVAVPWMAKKVRDLRPAKVVWLQDDVTSPRFYWLANPNPKGGQRVVAIRDGQLIRIDEATGVEELVIRLDDSMVDLDRPVRVVWKDGSALFEGPVKRSAGVLATTLAERRDPTGTFCAEIKVRIPADPTPAKATAAP